MHLQPQQCIRPAREAQLVDRGPGFRPDSEVDVTYPHTRLFPKIERSWAPHLNILYITKLYVIRYLRRFELYCSASVDQPAVAQAYRSHSSHLER